MLELSLADQNGRFIFRQVFQHKQVEVYQRLDLLYKILAGLLQEEDVYFESLDGL